MIMAKTKVKYQILDEVTPEILERVNSGENIVLVNKQMKDTLESQIETIQCDNKFTYINNGIQRVYRFSGFIVKESYFQSENLYTKSLCNDGTLCDFGTHPHLRNATDDKYLAYSNYHEKRFKTLKAALAVKKHNQYVTAAFTELPPF